MPFLQSYRNLTPRARLGVGLGILAWGTIGLYISDKAEKKLGFEPSETEKTALTARMPQITTIRREDKNS
ncbi:hypothetical protein BJ878DRAFT_484837 [Calycina marina]|uniref:Uncharacterized protein n=1 Tax=Calycina marina TaxID=1763456 RepID=A0A9P8CJG1_9HELO|nr:hypothetical protein BJ878DRAFT_484837 [Calycina marina]